MMTSKKIIKINIETVVKKTVGRKLHTYDTWNGDSMTITVEEVKEETDGVRFIGTNSCGSKSGIYVGKDYVKPLIRTGEAEKHNEVDHCDVRTTWSLK